MSAHIQPPFKTGVTSVTRVTHLVERPVPLASMPVTHPSGLSYTRCNVPSACNTKISALLLRADALRVMKEGFRWLRLQNIGRGIKAHTMREPLTND